MKSDLVIIGSGWSAKAVVDNLPKKLLKSTIVVDNFEKKNIQKLSFFPPKNYLSPSINHSYLGGSSRIWHGVLGSLDKFEEKKLPFNNLYLNTSYLDYKIYLKNQLLRDSDWASMSNSVELRVPFVNKTLISDTFQINPIISRKNILKKINKNISTQISEKKIGFYTPTYNKTDYHNPLKNRSFSVLKNYIETNNLKI